MMALFSSSGFRLHRASWVMAAALSVALSGCSLFSGKSKHEPTPLQLFTASMNSGVAWRVNLGGQADVGFAPAVAGRSAYAASSNGTVVKLDLESGATEWQQSVARSLSAGVGTDGRTVAVATGRGEVIALDDSGQVKWRAQASSEVMVPPLVGDGLVVVRSGDYRIQAYDAETGTRVWSLQRPGPSLALRTNNQMMMDGGFVFTGLPGGKLIAIDTRTGVLRWEGTVALPRGASELERVADVVGAPMVTGDLMCAVAFQGRITCFDINSGTAAWTKDFSSPNGLTLDPRYVFASDDQSVLHAFDLERGNHLWKQEALKFRRNSAPASIGRAVAVGDYQGQVHFFSREDGRLLSRVATDGRAIIAQPIAVSQGLLVQTSGANLFLLKLE